MFFTINLTPADVKKTHSQESKTVESVLLFSF